MTGQMLKRWMDFKATTHVVLTSDERNPRPNVVNNCVDGYTPYYDSCFRVITSEVNFQTAGATCQSDGYYLASIQDVYEQSFVETLLYANGGNPLWIGMKGDEVSRVF